MQAIYFSPNIGIEGVSVRKCAFSNLKSSSDEVGCMCPLFCYQSPYA